MATAAQRLEETEDDSDLKYPVIFATAANSTPTEMKQATLARQKLLHGTLAVPFDLTTFDPKILSEWECLKPLEIEAGLKCSSSDKLWPENWLAGCSFEGILPEGACVDMNGFYLKGGYFGKLGPENWASAYPVEWGLLDAHGQAIWIFLSKFLSPEESNVSSMTVAAVTGTQQQLPVSERLIIATAVERLTKSVAEDRMRALEEASRAINNAGKSLSAPLFAIHMLLNSKRSRRVDDVTDLLSLLGLDAINSIAYDQSHVNPPDGNNDDLWYALIRAAGHAGDRSLANEFLGSQFLALQEASVVAIGDVGDSSAKNDLRTIAEDTNRSPLIRELAEELASDLR